MVSQIENEDRLSRTPNRSKAQAEVSGRLSLTGFCTPAACRIGVRTEPVACTSTHFDATSLNNSPQPVMCFVGLQERTKVDVGLILFVKFCHRERPENWFAPQAPAQIKICLSCLRVLVCEPSVTHVNGRGLLGVCNRNSQ